MFKVVCLTLVTLAISLPTMAADMEYAVIEEPKLTDRITDQAESLIDWTPLASKGFERNYEKDAWTWSATISERLDLLCDIRPHEPPKPEVFYFGGLAFSR